MGTCTCYPQRSVTQTNLGVQVPMPTSIMYQNKSSVTQTNLGMRVPMPTSIMYQKKSSVTQTNLGVWVPVTTSITHQNKTSVTQTNLEGGPAHIPRCCPPASQSGPACSPCTPCRSLPGSSVDEKHRIRSITSNWLENKAVHANWSQENN